MCSVNVAEGGRRLNLFLLLPYLDRQASLSWQRGGGRKLNLRNPVGKKYAYDTIRQLAEELQTKAKS